MAVSRCPSCAVPLTSDEARRAYCHLCKAALDDDAAYYERLPPARKGWAVTMVGLITLLWGTAGVSMGTFWIVTLVGGITEIKEAAKKVEDNDGNAPVKRRDRTGQALTLFCMSIGTVLSILVVLQGLFSMLAAVGVLLRRQWGRILTFILAVLAFHAGIACVATGIRDACMWATGLAQVLYGVLTFFILIKYGNEFSRRTSISKA